MTMIRPLLAAALLLWASAVPAADPPTPSGILAGAPASAWRTIPADRLLVMDLAGGRRVVIELAPDFAPVHVAAIRALAAAHWWDGTSINRVQDDYVTQWGDATEKKPLPPGVVAIPNADYDRPAAGLRIRPLGYRDAYVARVGHAAGWPVAEADGRAWIPHCYGMVGVGRGMAPDVGSGAELYAVIGHAPRHLDRNVAVVGRVVAGMDALSALPRGTEALGFYAEARQRPGIVSIRLASTLPAAGRPAYQVLDTDGPAFAAWVRARANRKDDFFVRPAGAVDICNAQPPIRPAP